MNNIDEKKELDFLRYIYLPLQNLIVLMLRHVFFSAKIKNVNIVNLAKESNGD